MFDREEIEMEPGHETTAGDIASLLNRYLRKNFRLIAISLIALPSGAHAYDTEAYCTQVGAAAGGGAQLVAACREQEQTAKDNISRMSVPSRVMSYCQQVGQAAGGSYQFMESCIKEESKADDKLY
jgi:predicted solute-binding protein